MEYPGEGVACLGFAVDQGDGGRAAKPPAPVHQTALIGVGGKSAQGMDTGGDLDLLAPQADELGAVDQAEGIDHGARRPEGFLVTVGMIINILGFRCKVFTPYVTAFHSMT